MKLLNEVLNWTISAILVLVPAYLMYTIYKGDSTLAERIEQLEDQIIDHTHYPHEINFANPNRKTPSGNRVK